MDRLKSNELEFLKSFELFGLGDCHSGKGIAEDTDSCEVLLCLDPGVFGIATAETDPDDGRVDGVDKEVDELETAGETGAVERISSRFALGFEVLGRSDIEDELGSIPGLDTINGSGFPVTPYGPASGNRCGVENGAYTCCLRKDS